MKQSPIQSLCDGIAAVVDREREREMRESQDLQDAQHETRRREELEIEKRNARSLEQLAYAFTRIAESLNEIRCSGVRFIK